MPSQRHFGETARWAAETAKCQADTLRAAPQRDSFVRVCLGEMAHPFSAARRRHAWDAHRRMPSSTACHVFCTMYKYYVHDKRDILARNEEPVPLPNEGAQPESRCHSYFATRVVMLRWPTTARDDGRLDGIASESEKNRPYQTLELGSCTARTRRHVRNLAGRGAKQQHSKHLAQISRHTKHRLKRKRPKRETRLARGWGSHTHNPEKRPSPCPRSHPRDVHFRFCWGRASKSPASKGGGPASATTIRSSQQQAISSRRRVRGQGPR